MWITIQQANTLKQQYPFILGWELSDELETYKITIYINIYVDYEMVKEFYGLEECKRNKTCRNITIFLKRQFKKIPAQAKIGKHRRQV